MGQKLTKIGEFKMSKQKLGQGMFGEVYKGTMTGTGQPIALKKCYVGELSKLDVTAKEIRALEYIPEHENIVRILGYIFHENYAYIAMEFCGLGNLESYSEKKKTFTTTEKITIMYQCASGLDYMHSLKTPVAHRDLKPQNILFEMKDEKPVAKLGDFGLAKIVDDNTMLQTQLGTPLFMAPEMYKGENYTVAVDVFAMGLLYLAILRYEELGKMIPLPEGEDDLSKIEAYGGKIAACGGLLGEDIGFKFVHKKESDVEDVRAVKDVIEAMLQPMPNKRIKMSEVKPFLAGLIGLQAAPSEIIKGMASISDPEQQQTTRTKTLAFDRKSFTFNIGERVCIYPELEEVRITQRKSGRWDDKMQFTVGQPGFIDKRLSNGIYRVRFDDGNRFEYHEDVLHKLTDEDPIPQGPDSPIRYLDVVVIEKDSKALKVYQGELGDWSAKVAMSAGQRGVVHRLEKDGPTVVELASQDTFKYNPKALTKADPSRQRFEKDDLVIIKLDRRIVKKALGETPGWAEPMEKCLGEFGKIVKMQSDTIAKVDVDGNVWKWHVDCLTLVGKREEVLRATRRSHDTSHLVATLRESMINK